MKLLKSDCEKAWLFDAVTQGDALAVGLACFMPGCDEHVTVRVKDKAYQVDVPSGVVRSPVPVKISNARLALLISGSHE